jgi:hypothetical protein
MSNITNRSRNSRCGYRTVTQNIYVRPGSTFKMNDTMDKLGAGEVSAPPPSPVPPVEAPGHVRSFDRPPRRPHRSPRRFPRPDEASG